MLASRVTCSRIWASLRKATVLVVVDLGVVGMAGNRRLGVPLEEPRSLAADCGTWLVAAGAGMGGGMEVEGRRAAAAELGLATVQSTAEVFVVAEAGALMAIFGCWDVV